VIIWLASYPRSGNNYVRDMLESVYGIKTATIYNEPRRPKIDLEAARKTGEIFLVKTHELPDDDCSALYLVRDGRDALVSYARFIYVESVVEQSRAAKRWAYPAYVLYYLRSKLFRRSKDLMSFRLYVSVFRRSRVKDPPPEAVRQILHDLVTYNQSFGGWGCHVQAWTQRKAPTQIIKFEDLIQSPEPVELIRHNLEVLGYVLDPALSQFASFEALKRRRPDVYRRGQIGSHKSEMPEELEAVFWEHHGKVMHAMGYSR
jgi:hypothetical protein